MNTFGKKSIGALALAVASITALAACSSSSSSTPSSTSTSSGSIGLHGEFGNVPAEATGTQTAGTITVAEPPSSAPTWILPIVTGAANSVYTVPMFDYQMWRPLYWLVNGVEPKETPAMSLANDPTWSNGDKTVTFTLKSNYKWSNGQPITSQDVLFWWYEMKAALKESPANWAYYTPGLGIPDQVASISAPNSTTVQMNLTKSVNPTWFWQDEMGAIQPMPAQVWAKSSASGPILNFTNPANATAIYNYLSAQSKSLSTYATNPLWQIVDGPYKLTSFDSTSGAFTMAPNPSYGGPHATKESNVSFVSFTSDAAEFNAVKAGKIDLGYVPLPDVPQVSSLTGTYNEFGYSDFGWSYVAYNFKDTTGDFNNIIDKLYVRQATAHLEDQAGYIKAFFYGAGGEAYGPVPSIPQSPFTPANAMTNPYPFNPSSAEALLKDNGWSIVPNGTDTCVKPGTGAGECGAGIPAGTKLEWNRHLQHLSGGHRRAGGGPRLGGQEDRHDDEPVVEQLQLHDRQLQRPVVAQDDQQVGHAGLRRVHELDLPDHVRRVQLHRVEQPRRVHGHAGRQPHHRVDQQPERERGDQRGVVPHHAAAWPVPAEPGQRVRHVRDPGLGLRPFPAPRSRSRP